MSTYRPISSWGLFQRLRDAELLLIPSLDDEQLESAHEALELWGSAERTRLGLAEQLAERWQAWIRGIAEFGGQAEGWIWPSVYGDTVLKAACEAVFGSDLRSTLIRRGEWWRRVLVLGAPGSGRVAVGHAIRLLLSDSTVPYQGAHRGRKRSLAISASDFAEDLSDALFGGVNPTTHGSGMGLLSEVDGGSMLLDEVELCPGVTQAQLIACLRSHTTRVLGASTRADARVHFVGATTLSAQKVYGSATDLRRALVDELAIDGIVELPAFGQIALTERFWDEAFDALYRRAANAVCGMEQVSLFAVARPPQGDDVYLSEADVVLEERQAFMDWVCAASRKEQIRSIMRAAFAGYTWPGDLREFDAALRGILGSQTSTEVNGQQIEVLCARLRGQSPQLDEVSQVLQRQRGGWVDTFESELQPLPLVNETLPDVLSNVEAAYFKEAARRAALASQPRPAKMQDVARLLGLPRQTASRKWQAHGLSASLLTKD